MAKIVELPRIFLCYADKDKDVVEELYKKLSDAGYKPWMAARDLIPGQNWKRVIRHEIKNSHLFIVCLSKKSISTRSFLQQEINTAFDRLQELLDDDIYIIPLRLEELKQDEIPEKLLLFQWVDYFEKGGWDRLRKAIVKVVDILGLIKPVKLRSWPTENLLQKFTEEMLHKKSLFDIKMNWVGDGIKHHYESKTIKDDKVVVDHTTNLIWQQSGSKETMSSEDANEYISALNKDKYGGFSDWRLPTFGRSYVLDGIQKE